MSAARKRSFGDDEELLSGPNQTELASGQLFDGRRVVTQSVCPLCEAAVLLAEPCDRISQMLILAPDPGGLDESPLAGHSVRQQDCGC